MLLPGSDRDLFRVIIGAGSDLKKTIFQSDDFNISAVKPPAACKDTIKVLKKLRRDRKNRDGVTVVPHIKVSTWYWVPKSKPAGTVFAITGSVPRTDCKPFAIFLSTLRSKRKYSDAFAEKKTEKVRISHFKKKYEDAMAQAKVIETDLNKAEEKLKEYEALTAEARKEFEEKTRELEGCF